MKKIYRNKLHVQSNKTKFSAKIKNAKLFFFESNKTVNINSLQLKACGVIFFNKQKYFFKMNSTYGKTGLYIINKQQAYEDIFILNT